MKFIRKMDFLKLLIFVGLSDITLCMNVYEWQRVWGQGSTTREFAQVHQEDRTIVHYSTEINQDDHTPTISMLDFKFTAEGFENGIAAVRPLVTGGNQICFITSLDGTWSNTETEFSKYHAKSVAASTSNNKMVLRQSFPSELDPLTVDSVKEFCNVDSDHIFYMTNIKSLRKFETKMRIHTTLGLMTIGIPDTLVDIIYAASPP